jgi:YhcH/YjgK/YiaL family protein
MFYSNANVAEKYNYLDEKFLAAYKWLKEQDLNALSAGKYPILGEDVVANVQEYETLPVTEKKFETHDLYFDIQYLVKGVELFGICKRDGLKEKSSNPEKDVVFYETPKNYGYVILNEGDLVVVAPEDAHMPGCAVEDSIPVKKVVIKVKI